MSDDQRNRSGSNRDPRRRLGSLAEDLCADALEQRGWRIVARNWRVRMGEIDIIAVDGSQLVVVEVKCLRKGNTSGPERPVLAVGRNKQRRLRLLASSWLQYGGRWRHFETVRFDVVGITIGDDGAVAAWQHVERAF